MPGLCSHEFFWPLRSADGNYYQVCRLCGVQYAYDWDNMRRRRGGAQTSVKPGVFVPGENPYLKRGPSLSLLVELEPAYRVFFRNLAELLRPAPADETGLPKVPFWREILFDSGIPWVRFGESMVCHMIALAVLLIMSQWTTQEMPRRRSMFENTHLTYYKPTGSFPALRGNPGRARPAFKKQAESARGGAPLRVAPERAQAAINAPDIKLNGPAQPNITAAKLVLPALPLASTMRSRLTVPAGSMSVVAPPPEVHQSAINQSASRRLGLGQGSVVAPTPELGAASSRRGIAVPGAAVVGPAPTVQGSLRRVGDINIGPSAVVAPSPRLPVGEQGTTSGAAQRILGGAIAMAVPPPPSVQPSGSLGNGRAGLPSGGGVQVVPPPPSVQSAGDGGNSVAGARLRSLSGTGTIAGLPSGGGVQVVPPPPSVQSARDGGNSVEGGRLRSLSGTGSIAGLQAVPPPPSLQGAGDSGGGRSGSALSSGGVQVVPPAPSVQGAGNSGGGRSGNALSNAGLQGVGPAPSVGAGGTSGRGGQQMAMNVAPGLAPASAPIINNARPAATEKPPEPATEEMPLRLIGMAMALPNSSYFSNYEVFIAERRLSKGLAQLIKLVYVSLPYQRRLSEYGVDDTKVFKLRVSRDRSCDESLLQMTWPENDPHPDAHNSTDSPALSADDRNGKLPCYRTTADDYRKAISRR